MVVAYRNVVFTLAEEVRRQSFTEKTENLEKLKSAFLVAREDAYLRKLNSFWFWNRPKEKPVDLAQALWEEWYRACMSFINALPKYDKVRVQLDNLHADVVKSHDEGYKARDILRRAFLSVDARFELTDDEAILICDAKSYTKKKNELLVQLGAEPEKEETT